MPFTNSYRIISFFTLFLVSLIANWLIASAQTTSFEATTEMKTQTRYVVHSLEQLHYLNKPIQSLNMQDCIETYMSDLDFNRMFFLQKDADVLKERFTSILSTYLRQQGNLFPAFEIFKTYQERALARIEWILKEIDTITDFTSDEYFEPDRKKSSWETSTLALDAIWRKRLKYEIINELLLDKKDIYSKLSKQSDTDRSIKEGSATIKENPSPKIQEDNLAQAQKAIKKRYVRFQETINTMDASDVQSIFLSSLTSLYDPHSTFLSSESMEELNISVNNSLVGIGVVIFSEDGYCTIKDLIPNGPAEKSKQIKPNDKIIGISDENEKLIDVIGMRQKNIVKLLRGKAGTSVYVLIQPSGMDASKAHLVHIIREEIKLTESLAKGELFEIPSENKLYKIGVIDLPAFYGSREDSQCSSTKDVEQLLNKLKNLGAQGIILDLRSNLGGLFEEAINLAGLFIPAGIVLQAKDSLGQINSYRNYNKTIAWDGPLILLTSRHTASSSEIVAGALKNYKRALIVGDETTHGKGTMQGVYEIDKSLFSRFNKTKMGAVKITIRKFYLPSGDSTQIKGVPSDITLPSINSYLPIGEDSIPHALPWDNITPAFINIEPLQTICSFILDPNTISKLRNLSQERQKTLPEFEHLQEVIAWFKDKKDEKSFSLNLSKRQEQSMKDKAFKDKLNEELKELAKNAYKSKEVLLDEALINQTTKEDKNEKEDEPAIDIHLQESVRIMQDWLKAQFTLNQ